MNGTRLIFALVTAMCLGVAAPHSPAQSLDDQADAGPSHADLRPAATVSVTAIPARPWIEHRGEQQLINFDLLLENNDSVPYRLIGVKLRVLDVAGQIEVERELNENGRPPALDVVGERKIAPGAVLDVYEPFTEFDRQIELTTMRVELLLMRGARDSPPAAFGADVVLSVDVRPQAYTPEAYCLPLQGRVLVHDGHDLFSHHRRYNLAARFKASKASAVSANLYAYDFMATDRHGDLFEGSPLSKERWLSYGMPVVAPTRGVVMASVSSIAENTFSSSGEPILPPQAEQDDPNGFGNYVTILAGDGRVSWLLHLQPGSVTVHAGEHVEAGQVIGKVGFSGDSLFPHLHFNVTDDASYPSQGVPSYFKDFDRILGSRTLHERIGQIDSGDLIKAGRCIR